MSEIIRRKLSRTLLAALLLASAVAAQQPRTTTTTTAAEPDPARLRAHVAHLASERLDGRRTGTPGAVEAARYVASEFKRYGLAPGAGAGEYLQTFPYVAGVELGNGNSLVLATRAKHGLRVGDDWMPLGFSASASVGPAPVVFVGYGITAADQNYDDYKGVDVSGRVALALAGTPDGDNPHGRFTRAGEPRFKAAAARAAGASALLIVASEREFKDDRAARLSYDNSAGDAGLPVAVVSKRAAADMLGLVSVMDGAANLEFFERVFREWKSGAKAEPPRELQAARDTLRVFTLAITTDLVRKPAPATNVVGILEGSDPKLREEVIVVGAHYDHLGRGGHGSRAEREGEIHYGADDNASGTAALLELARLASANRAAARRTVVFVAFGGEEEGLLGSNHFVNNPPFPLDRTVAMLNMDMVGRLREDKLMVGGVGTAAEWRQMLERANGATEIKVAAAGAEPGRVPDGVPVVVAANGAVVATAGMRRPFALSLNEDGYGPSDHSSFYGKQVPVLFFFTGTHDDYHRPTDTAERINYEGLAAVASLVGRLLADLQAAERRPAYTTAKVEQTARATGFRVYLGTVPSYNESTDGMLLEGVREGSPAAAAGLQAGDRVVRLAGRDVRNVYDYTQALSGMQAGQEYEVEIVRGAERLKLTLTPAARK